MGKTKELFMEMREQLAEIAEEAENGYISEMEVYAELSSLEKEVKKVREQVLDVAIIEFERYGEKTVLLDNFQISKTASGRHTYLNNADWAKKTAEIKEIQRKMQLAYKSPEKVFIDPATGEIFEPSEYRANKESLSIKIAK